MSFLAPQAYTKETLSKAFDWLQYQPDQVKQVATSPDVLVGLFLKAQRQGIDNIDIDAPVSSKKFLSDLKNLKKDIAQFEDGAGSSSSAPQTTYMQPPEHNGTQNNVQNAMQNSVQTQVTQTTTVSETKSMSLNSTSLLSALDPQSLQSIRIVQERFNLSSPQEALRMIISVGTKQIAHWP